MVKLCVSGEKCVYVGVEVCVCRVRNVCMLVWKSVCVRCEMCVCWCGSLCVSGEKGVSV